MKYESNILERLIKTYGVVGNPKYLSEIIKQFIIQGKECYPNLFTYQSDWLSHIDEFGLANDYVVTYTGQRFYAPNTKGSPVKHATLYGHTLVNLEQSKHSIDEYKKYTLVKKLAENKRYIAIFPYLNNAKYAVFNMKPQVFIVEYTTSNKLIFTTPSSPFEIRLYVNIEDKSYNLPEEAMDILCIEYQEGMENWDIPYFEGMQSVKLPVLTTSNVIQSVKFEKLKPDLSNGSLTPNESEYSSSGCIEYFDISKLSNAKFVFKSTQPFTEENYFTFLFYDKDKTYIKWLNGQMTKIADGLYTSTIPTVENAKYLRITKYDRETQMSNIVKNSISAFVDNSLSIDPTFTIKSNILTVNEEVELGSVGEVKDELNLLTGQLTQRTETRAYQEGDESNSEVLTDMTNTRYKLPKEAIKTVDLTILDQNGQNVKQLMSFNGGTHFNTTSLEGSPLPMVSVSVETDLEEILMMCSLEGNTL